MYKATVTRRVPKYGLSLVAGHEVSAPDDIMAKLAERGLVEKAPARKPSPKKEAKNEDTE